MLFDFIERLEVFVIQNPYIRTVYFHNFSRFDGIILLKHLVLYEHKYTIKPIMRNHRLYELAVYLGKKQLFSLRDSLHLLPNSLKQLGRKLLQ